ncbi:MULTISPECIES: hypothetical protein [Bradyrhizobium]|uniref:Glycosyltransferase RgtA/B/C/D-like domain-containing protein n=1 Tax=Bradyrhizobium brasilense TaxID=1419277 RepID=A0ABY8J786_9BRAD|nr:hypothetical protein [Bradyrhizobium brasilense]WFU61405.1 hypothetical protein QA636_28390 [Bradyrhizobium brasilense]
MSIGAASLPSDFGTESSISTFGSLQGRLWLATAIGLVVVLLAPLFVIDVPPIEDYPNHLARFFVLAHPDDAVLSTMYAPHWTILPNLGMDLIGTGLLRIVGPYTGGKILLALSLLAPLVGVVIYHRVVFGCLSWWPLASGLTAYNAAFFLGFMNFLLSLGVAFVGAATWVALRRQNRLARMSLAGAVASTLAFFTHIFGLAFLFVLIGAHEAAALRQRSSSTVTLSDVARASVPMAVAFAPAVVLYELSPFSDATNSIGDWEPFAKAVWLFSPFAVMNLNLTIVTAGTFVAALFVMRRRLEFAPGLWLALTALAIVYVATPWNLKGGSFIELRIAVIFALLMFSNVRPRIPRRDAMMLGSAIAILVIVRSAVAGASWIDTRSDLADLRAAIADIEPGARVMVATGDLNERLFSPPQRVLPGFYRLTNHLPALLLIERKAFWPLLFASPAQQPITILPPFDRIAHPLMDPVKWSKLAAEPYAAETLRRARYLVQWRTNFDYLLLIDPDSLNRTVAKLTPLHDGAFAKLYRIDR